MAYTWLTAFFLYSYILFVSAQNCLIYDFENDADSFIGNEKSICSGMQSWSVGKYSEIGMEAPNSESDTFIAVGVNLGCATSFYFPMSAGGVVEADIYVGDGERNQLTLLANIIVDGGNDAVVGSSMTISSDAGFVSGWQTVKLDLVGFGDFDGYLTFLGASSEDSVVLIDSFRYIPPGFGSCDDETATEGTAEEEEQCVTYNFESDFDIRFTTDNYLCSGFLPWHLDNYTSIDIDSPHVSSTVFMTPNEVFSCISSFVFKMSPDGIVEANVYMDPVTALDHIIVLAQRVTDKEYDTVAGFKMYHPENQVFVVGWNVLRFSLLDLTSFEGYLIFFGSAERGSTVLVDSVRYIPPFKTAEDETCALY